MLSSPPKFGAWHQGLGYEQVFQRLSLYSEAGDGCYNLLRHCREGTPGENLKQIRIEVGFNEAGTSPRYWNYSTCNIGIEVQPESPSCIRSWFEYPKKSRGRKLVLVDDLIGF